jgi:putative ABC transport system permease protein
MFLRDLRFALRGLLREPRFSVPALITLALGIGANVAVFAVFEAVMLRPLPYDAADELVILNHRDRRTGITKEFIALGDFVDLAARQSRLDQLVLYGSSQSTLHEPTGPVRLALLNAGPGLFETLHVIPALGRGLVPEDAVEGAGDVGLLGYEFWQSHYRGDPAIVGRSIPVGNSQVQIVGVTPAGFRFPPGDRVDLVVNATVPVSPPGQRDNDWTFAMGRLKPGATAETASSDLGAISSQLEREYPASNAGSEYFALPLRDAMVGSTKGAFPLLLAGVAVVLLIACANVANLLLVRALGRQRNPCCQHE